MYRASRHLGKITGHFSPTVPPFCRWVLSRADTGGDAWWRMLERLTKDRTISLKAAVRSCTNMKLVHGMCVSVVYEPAAGALIFLSGKIPTVPSFVLFQYIVPFLSWRYTAHDFGR